MGFVLWAACLLHWVVSLASGFGACFVASRSCAVFCCLVGLMACRLVGGLVGCGGCMGEGATLTSGNWLWLAEMAPYFVDSSAGRCKSSRVRFQWPGFVSGAVWWLRCLAVGSGVCVLLWRCLVSAWVWSLAFGFVSALRLALGPRHKQRRGRPDERAYEETGATDFSTFLFSGAGVSTRP